MHRLIAFSASSLFALVCAVAAGQAPPTIEPELLDSYAGELDDSFRWELAETYEPRAGARAFTLDMTSQTWRGPGEVSHPQWTHMLQVIVPEDADGGTALLVIGGGSRREEPPRHVEEAVFQIALAAGTPVVYLANVPNQPMEIRGDGERRYEDDLLAETIMAYAETDDPTWVIHLAMAKSAVAAMTATEQFLSSREDLPDVEEFVIAGASKRGWTTWLAAAVDDRVRAIVPIVIDVLNLQATMRHHYGAYGFWAPAIHDYADRGITTWFGSPKSKRLRRILDPYLFRDRFNMPKLLLNAAGDQFFLPDTTRYYFDDLPGPTYLNIVPNASHGMVESPDAIMSAVAFYRAIVDGAELPELSWQAGDEPGTLIVESDPSPMSATLWQAHNPEARDFRVAEIGAAWESTRLGADDTGRYEISVDVPEQGFRAFFVRVRYPLDTFAFPLTFTTEVQVVPDVLPHAPEVPEAPLE